MTRTVGTNAGTEAPATLGRLLACEDAAVAELAPETRPEVEAVVTAEVAALRALPPESLVEAEANLRVLLDEHEDAVTDPTEDDRAVRESAAESLRSLTPDAHLTDG